MSNRFDRRAWRLLERLALTPEAAYRRLQEEAPGLVARWDPAARAARVPLAAAMHCQGRTAELTAEQAVTAFQHAVGSGAHGVAGELLSDVRRVLATLPIDVRKRTERVLRSHLLAVGDVSAAGLEEPVLANTNAGEPLRPFMLAKSIDEGELPAATVSRRLEQHRIAVLRNPQLHLLLHRCHVVEERERSVRSLNRYLRTQGLAPAVGLDNTGNYLRDLRFSKPVPVCGGPLVSILVSAYNAEETISYAVRSILEQSYRNIEILICDDNSTDGTREILSREFSEDPRITLFASNRNQGTYNIRNALLERSGGELITVHDADDLCLARRIELQVRQLRAPAKKASVTNLLRVQPNGRIEFFRDQNASRMSIVSLMARRRVFETLGPYRQARFGADFEFLEALKARYGPGSVARIRSPQMLCLWSEQSVTKQSGAQALASGYRSPARRLYCDLVYRQRILGAAAVPSTEIDAKLQGSGNWREPSSITPL